MAKHTMIRRIQSWHMVNALSIENHTVFDKLEGELKIISEGAREWAFVLPGWSLLMIFQASVLPYAQFLVVFVSHAFGVDHAHDPGPQN